MLVLLSLVFTPDECGSFKYHVWSNKVAQVSLHFHRDCKVKRAKSFRILSVISAILDNILVSIIDRRGLGRSKCHWDLISIINMFSLDSTILTLKYSSFKEERCYRFNSFPRRQILFLLGGCSSVRKTFSFHLIESLPCRKFKLALSLLIELFWVNFLHYSRSLNL